MKKRKYGNKRVTYCRGCQPQPQGQALEAALMSPVGRGLGERKLSERRMGVRVLKVSTVKLRQTLLIFKTYCKSQLSLYKSERVSPTSEFLELPLSVPCIRQLMILLLSFVLQSSVPNVGKLLSFSVILKYYAQRMLKLPHNCTHLTR